MKIYLISKISKVTDLSNRYLIDVLVDNFNYSTDYLVNLLSNISKDKHKEFLKTLIEDSNKEYIKIHSCNNDRMKIACV